MNGLALAFGSGGSGRFNPAAPQQIDVAQAVGVDSQPATLGVIEIGQAVDVQGAGSTNADIATLAGMVWVLDSLSTKVRSDASLTFGSALDNAAWTKSTTTTITANVTGTQDRVVVGATKPPTVQQAITNAQFVASGMVPCTITWWFSFETIQWAVICGRNGSTVNRQWFDIQNGVVGVSDSGMTSPTITPETRNGVAGYRCSVKITGSGGALFVRLALSTTNTTITDPATATSILCDDCTVDQKRWESWQDRVTGSLFQQLTVNNQPGYLLDGSGEHMVGYGATLCLISVDATHVAALSGTNKEYAIHYVAQPTNIKALGAIVGSGNSGQATNSTRLWGTSTTGNGRYTSNTVDDAGATSVIATTTDQAGDYHVGEWFTSGSGAGLQVNHQKNGAAANPSATAQVTGANTPNRVALLIMPRATLTSPFIGKVSASACHGGTPDTGIRSQVRVSLGTQFGITVAP